jgi:hypothetical protein
MLASTSETKTPAIPNFSDIKAIIQDHGCSAYSMPIEKHMLEELLQSPRTYGMPKFIPSTSHTFMVAPTTFKRWGDLSREDIEAKNTSRWLYQEDRPTPNLFMDNNNKGL